MLSSAGHEPANDVDVLISRPRHALQVDLAVYAAAGGGDENNNVSDENFVLGVMSVDSAEGGGPGTPTDREVGLGASGWRPRRYYYCYYVRSSHVGPGARGPEGGSIVVAGVVEASSIAEGHRVRRWRATPRRPARAPPVDRSGAGDTSSGRVTGCLQLRSRPREGYRACGRRGGHDRREQRGVVVAVGRSRRRVRAVARGRRRVLRVHVGVSAYLGENIVV